MRIFVLVMFFVGFLFASFDFSERFTLRKDEIIHYKINAKDLLFRWTLFHNEGLVYLCKFDAFAYQGVLYANHSLRAFNVKIAPASSSDTQDSYCMISFLKCNEKITSCDFSIDCVKSDKFDIKKIEEKQ